MRPPLFTGYVADDELAKLRAAVRAADPGAVAVPGRVVRRVLRHTRPFSPFAFHTPHGDGCAVRRDQLLQVVRHHELGLAPETKLPERILLLALPETRQPCLLAKREHRRLLWRRLFHARVHAALEEKIESGALRPSRIASLVHGLGQTVFDEVRAVLRQEERVLPPEDDTAVFVEFAAFYLEHHSFEPYLLPLYFPSAPRPETVIGLLEDYVEPEALLEETRIAGAGEAVARAESSPGFDLPARVPLAMPEAGRRRALLSRSIAAANRANHVRAAILAQRAGSPQKAEAEIGRLLVRLANVLDLPDDAMDAWRWGLRSLVPAAARGFRPVSARILLDLQKICVDHERGLFTVDVPEWLLTLGRRPVKRPLPMAVLVRRVRRLESAKRRLTSLAIDRAPGAELLEPLRAALDKATHVVEGKLVATIGAALDEVGLKPANVPERVAARKLTEELAESAVERGRLRMGDVRDAVSRNDMKLTGPRGLLSLVRRDPLLRLDRALADSLDGVYRRGEFYLRWLHRFSTVVLGTLPGSLLVRFAILPFGGAFVALEGLQHIVGPILAKTAGIHLHLATYSGIAILGVFLLLLIHVGRFREGVGSALHTLGSILRGVFISLPTWLVWRPIVARFLDSRFWHLFVRVALKPAVYAAALTGVTWWLFDEGTALRSAAPLFLVALFATNLPAWLRAEEAFRDGLARNWRYFHTQLVAGVVRAVIAFFKLVLDAFDRVLHAVDEWLRFRGGEGQLSFAVKAAVGPLWFVASYVVRLYVNLLVEPQVNPVKHFPVVTVSHKIILPMSPVLLRFFRAPLTPLGPVAANTIAGSTVFLLPGVFGFLVWELKENWRLFDRNRARSVRPVPVGHHGETVVRLLKPGFHSGTLPKLYARLRRAESLPDHRERRRKRQVLTHARTEVERLVGNFVEREFLRILAECGRPASLPLALKEVVAGSNGLRLRIGAPGDDDLILGLDEQSGRLLAGVVAPGWLHRISPGSRLAVRNALLCLYKKAGVELVREQIQGALGRKDAAYDIAGRDLVVWPDRAFARAIRYDLSRRPVIRARPLPGLDLPMSLPTAEVLFAASPLRWCDWAKAWGAEQSGRWMPEKLLEGVPVFPEREK